MRLKKLQVSGFKSFVDSTDIRLPAHLVGVVGPNGCGKSNVIDAVRWVMGESSAKTLRGDNMSDVIFNGSAVRKPVGKASVELVFDNSDGRAPGNYGQFAEISVKRTLTRDGQSRYSINNLKTRRKDVLDLFRGTGLGPRSYSIIEQGMVSRIVEAKPEDLRIFVEEAAGTSKYKDRRRETETRIAHTRENLDRVSDIRDELGKQLRRLKRQSASARRYKKLKEEERLIFGQLQVLRLRVLDGQLLEQDRLTAQYENALQAALASQRQTESELEALRKQQSDANESNAEVQQEFYRTGAEITKIEQRIEHLNETRKSQSEELDRLKEMKVEWQKQIELELQKGIRLKEELEKIFPELESLQTSSDKSEMKLAEAERILQDWLVEMEDFNEQSRAPAQQIEIQKSRIEYLEQHLARSVRDRVKLELGIEKSISQMSNIDIAALRLEVAKFNQKYEAEENRFDALESEIKNISSELEKKRDMAANTRTQMQEIVSRLHSLKEIQNAALGGKNDALESWLLERGFGDAPKLAESIKVAKGWERAADRILNGFLGAFCADSIAMDTIQNHHGLGVSLISNAKINNPVDRIELPGLLEKIDVSNANISTLLSGIYVADSLEQALGYQPILIGRECVVTREGILVGPNWVNFPSEIQMETGILVREEEINKLQQDQQDQNRVVKISESEVLQLENRRNDLEAQLQKHRGALNRLRSEMSSLHNRFGREETQYQEAQEKSNNLKDELEALTTQIMGDQSEIENARALLDTAAQQTGSLDQKRAKLIERRNQLNVRVVECRKKVSEQRELLHAKALDKQSLESNIDSTRENIKRLHQDIEQSDRRVLDLTQEDNNPAHSIDELETALNELMEKKIEIDTRFSSSKDKAASYNEKISRANSILTDQIEDVNQAREVLDQQKLARQEILVRRDTQSESIQEKGYSIEECEGELPENSTVEQWQEALSAIELKISRIGPVNLVAIEEFDEESERMEYLETQHLDLTEALETLESVIRKIDRETRNQFKETFDKINLGFNEFFPKLFGGGKAELHLTSDDYLTAGIGVMARPPGKRNSHIHLLSGGEKALTAVALLFSLFKLNPAPFCMLDEVDAPLDDANVDRYCETLKTLADVSQMIVITHNKITMEAMELLVGVTMAEAGVSRLVSVDIDQALEMAAQ